MLHCCCPLPQGHIPKIFAVERYFPLEEICIYCYFPRHEFAVVDLWDNTSYLYDRRGLFRLSDRERIDIADRYYYRLHGSRYRSVSDAVYFCRIDNSESHPIYVP